jgi:hypothetical protein
MKFAIMQHKITTHKGDTILLIEVPLDAYDFAVVGNNLTFLRHNVEENCGYGIIRTNNHLLCEIIGTTSTLTDKDVEPFVEKLVDASMLEGGRLKQYKNYNFNKPLFDKPLESWNSFLQHYGIDLSKEWVVLKLKND